MNSASIDKHSKLEISFLCFKNFGIFLWYALEEQSISIQPLVGRLDRASASEMADAGSILNQIKPKTTIIDIHNLPA